MNVVLNLLVGVQMLAACSVPAAVPTFSRAPRQCLLRCSSRARCCWPTSAMRVLLAAAVFWSVRRWVRLLRRPPVLRTRSPVRQLRMRLLRLLQPPFRVRGRFRASNQLVFMSCL